MTTAGEAKRKRARRALALLIGMTVVGVVGCGALIALRVFVFEGYQIDGPAMEPAYFDGDRVVVDHTAAIARGDVVIIRRPEDGIAIVKRVVALGGDRVAIDDDVIVLNGERLEQRPLGPARPSDDPSLVCAEERLGEASWRVVWSDLPMGDSLAEQRIPPEHIFVLGDHRDRSNDSRNPRIGAVPLAQVVGRVTATITHGRRTVTCPP